MRAAAEKRELEEKQHPGSGLGREAHILDRPVGVAPLDLGAGDAFGAGRDEAREAEPSGPATPKSARE